MLHVISEHLTRTQHLSTDYPIAALADYENLKNGLSQEREAFVKIHSFSDDVSFIRSVEEAALILGFRVFT